tara:strand:+ start:643 stop:1656 length:1014 start_codon:yes stop_codon:yes gene_type:complete
LKLLVADIGGTNARFGYQENNGSEIKHVEFLNCVDFANIGQAIAHYVSKNSLNIENLSLSIAGPCGDNFVKFTNNHWSFDKIDLLNETNCNSLLAINDFAAQGLGFTDMFSSHSSFLDKKILDRHQLVLLHHGKSLDGTNVLITGPGTGLGVGTLVFINNVPLPIQGEGGNVHFSPASNEEIKLLEWLSSKTDYVSTEEVLSGRGLVNIYNYLCFKENHTSEMSTADQIGIAAKEGNILARNAARLMVEIFATSIANNILVTGSQKCVIICGGISAKLSDVFGDSKFHERLCNKGKYKNYVSDVPILLSFDDNNGLKGSAEAFYNPFFQKQKVFISG